MLHREHTPLLNFMDALELVHRPEHCRIGWRGISAWQTTVGDTEPTEQHPKGRAPAPELDLALAKAVLEVSEEFSQAAMKLVDMLANGLPVIGASRPAVTLTASLSSRNTFQVHAAYQHQSGVADAVLVRIVHKDIRTTPYLSRAVAFDSKQEREFSVGVVEAIRVGLDRLLKLAAHVADVTVDSWATMPFNATKLEVSSMTDRANMLLERQERECRADVASRTSSIETMLRFVGGLSLPDYQAAKFEAGETRLSRIIFLKTGVRVSMPQLAKIDAAIAELNVAQQRLDQAVIASPL